VKYAATTPRLEESAIIFHIKKNQQKPPGFILKDKRLV
jgi:hypothetical protein